MTPSRKAFSEREWQIICRLKTPQKVQQFLNKLPYNQEKKKETLRTFRQVLRLKTAHCLEAALTAAVILEQHGYPPLLLDLESQDDLDHVLFVYRKDKKWGTVARSRDPGLHGRRPVFKTLHELVQSYAAPYVDHSARIIGFGVCNLQALGTYNWRLSDRNVWNVERFLIGMSHQRFHMSEKTYRYWKNRFLHYTERYPDRKPCYFPNRRFWLPGYQTNL